MERDELLERRIIEAPDDPTGYAVYGDWLSERGDPRGELCAVQLALDDDARLPDAVLRWREQHLLRHHLPALLGEIAVYPDAFAVGWRYGFVRTLRVDDVRSSIAGPTRRAGLDPVPVLERLLASAAGRFVETLEVQVDRPDNDYGGVLAALAASGPHPTVRALLLGVERAGAGLGGQLGDLGATFPRLRSLVLRRGYLSFARPLVLPELEELSFDAAWLGRAAIEALIGTPRPRLRSLFIDQPGYSFDATAQPLLDGAIAPRLRALRIRTPCDPSTILDRLARSRILAQLDVLDLSNNGLCDDDFADFIRRAAPRLALRLDVSENALSQAGVARLRRVFPNVVADLQSGDDDE